MAAIVRSVRNAASAAQSAVATRPRTALVTLPALRQDVQTLSRLGEPFTKARTRWMFGFQRRFVRRWEWLTFIPNEGCLPHTSHTAGIVSTSSGANGS
jgi:hypothetical protein